ncbi:uncharacterized protein PgNI_03338 [Pyricularia grisea]|uniref:Uncharacterized protein n=1 Tax=Pyricularia grisea TaxID=148305 RepID=A0A6P8B9W1_PYRGI|nr:uncharacterized protein PgNI_03338 [Pyricularia grisea]TLD12605.1 hypothetical protein PgNI_03338 [Pyricularia grisea]
MGLRQASLSGFFPGNGRSSGGCERQAKKAYEGSTKGAKQGSGLPIPRVITKGLEMFPLPTGVIAALCQAPVPSSLVKDRDKFRTNDALNLEGRCLGCTHPHNNNNNNLLTLTPMFLAKSVHFLYWTCHGRIGWEIAAQDLWRRGKR